MRKLLIALASVSISCLLASCGAQQGSVDGSISPASQANEFGFEPAPQTGFPTKLPEDELQPWESETRSTNGVDSNSDFTAGRDWFSTSSSGVSENGEAAHLEGGQPGSSYGIWRIPLGGEQPGTISLDVNLLDNGSAAASEFYVGIANYASGRWDWHGPFADSHVRLSTAEVIRNGGNYLSTVQNTFVSVLVSGSNKVDVIGISLNPYDGSDGNAPGIPDGLVATSVAGGLELQWNPVIADDLAGYRIFHSGRQFINPHSAGVRQLDSLEGSTRMLLETDEDSAFVRIAAIDHNANESSVSQLVSGKPLAGGIPQLLVTTDSTGGLLGSPATLIFSGADSFDIDSNGDGIFDVTGNTSGAAVIDTGNTGIIRPRVRGTGSGGEAVALGAVSLVITGNSRPLASATASPQSGKAPLGVTFTGSAEDAEDDASALIYAWDFDGDGIYEAGTDSLTPAAQNYSTPGIYNVKFRVTDSQGASDVDTVSVLVTDPDNQAPVADLQANSVSGIVPLDIAFDASGSSDSDGNIILYEWDFNNDGIFDASSDSPMVSNTYSEAGVFECRVRVTDNSFATDTDVLGIMANSADGLGPVAGFQVRPNLALTGQQITFDGSASFSQRGTIELYQWDFNGDGVWDASGNADTALSSIAVQGDYTARLRVTDSFGATEEVEVTYSVSNTVYSQFGWNGLNWNQSPYYGPTTNNLRWDFTFGDDIDGGGVSIASDGTLYVPSWDNSLHALNPDGTEKWAYGTPSNLFSTPSISADGTIYFTTSFNKVFALHPNGDLKWKFSSDTNSWGGIKLDRNGNLLHLSTAGTLYCIRPDGTEKWKYESNTGTAIYGYVAISPEGVMYFGDPDGRLIAINPDGSFRWEVTLSTSSYSSPMIGYDGTIYVGGGSSAKLYAVDPEGNILWSFDTSANVRCTPALLIDGRILIGDDGGDFYCVLPDGSESWSLSLGVELRTQALVDAANNIYIGNSSGTFYCLDSNGNEVWSSNLPGGWISASPSIGADGTVYIGSWDNKLYAFGPTP
ncbi:PQQ-binding-like beta-propeller repeat protein [bacterium]|nr:PQQ-binding-like beta-propeller repeat protein [bacterium]